ncbi:MAG: thiol reductase thioredoxin [Rhodospirillaceae bacterium]|nr:thiol reductase thioredoxin [Rhodospirillaceae bacterium]HAA93519.1 thioredoxin [Rhodospirillaceae bacterium]
MADTKDGLIAVVKRDCPTCELVAPVLKRLQDTGTPITIYSQDDPSFPEATGGAIDDTSLEQSFRHDIEFVPTLIRQDGGKESDRVFGWNREEWEKFTGIQGLGEGLPENQPGCGSKSLELGIPEQLQARYGDVPMKSRKIEFSEWDDPVEQAFDRGWTDGLPIVPPTDDRILRMLSGTDRAPDEVVGIMPPDMKECTVEKIAINAVMAGARPEYMPVILAVVEAALKPKFTLHGVLCTLFFSGPVIVANGPVTKSIGMNWGHNCLGQGNRANATIGRSLQLLVRNVGGGRPGEIDRAVFGNPGKYTFCFAEDETDPDWEPLHVSRGCKPGSNAVTLHHGHGVTAFSEGSARSADELARSLSLSLVNDLHPRSCQKSNVIVAISPEHYRIYKEDGWGRKEIEEALHHYTTRPGKDLVKGKDGVSEGIDPSLAEEMIPKFWRDHGILLVRAGGTAGLQTAIIGGWGGGRNREEIQPVTHAF